jgi:membrane protein YqaA with SNARE-associated domain
MILPRWQTPRCGRCISGHVRDPVSGKRSAARLIFTRGQPAAARRALIAKGVMDFVPTIAILTAAASLGCWLSYLQGRWLGNTETVKGWLAHLPHKYHQRATCMFDKHGLLALLAGRFLAFVRTLLPTMAGISGSQPPLPVLQLAERAVGRRGHRSGLCAEHDPVREAP